MSLKVSDVSLEKIECALNVEPQHGPPGQRIRTGGHCRQRPFP